MSGETTKHAESKPPTPFFADSANAREAACRSDEAVGKLDLTRQHAIIAAVLDHVVVGPGRQGYNRFDESRLTPVWRV